MIMDNFIKKLKGYTRIFYWVFVFVMTAVLLFLSMPGNMRFKYEYQKGFPWKHENLVAPFDFAILKTSEEIEKEMEEQMQLVVPYFLYDTTVAGQMISLFENDWQQLVSSEEGESDAALQEIEQELQRIYETGILPR